MVKLNTIAIRLLGRFHKQKTYFLIARLTNSFVRRCENMARWMVCSKRGRFLLARYSQIARKIRKINNKRWSILWIKHFSIILPNLTCFLEKNPHFILVYTIYTWQLYQCILSSWRRARHPKYTLSIAHEQYVFLNLKVYFCRE